MKNAYICRENIPGGLAVYFESDGSISVRAASSRSAMFPTFAEALAFIDDHLSGGRRNWVVEQVR